MKRIVTVALVVIFSTQLASAQVFTFGPKAGFNFSRINIDESAAIDDIIIASLEDNRKVGVAAGGYLQFNIGPFNIQPEVVFSHNTASLEFTDFSFSDLHKVRFNRLDIPLLGGFNLGRSVRVQAGPVMTYVLDVNVEQGAGNLVEAFVKDFDNKAWGYQVGGGLDLGRLALDFRYGSGIGKRTIDLEVGGDVVPVDYRINTMQVTAGINIIK